MFSYAPRLACFETDELERAETLVRPPRTLLVLGAAALCTMLAEGAAAGGSMSGVSAGVGVGAVATIGRLRVRPIQTGSRADGRVAEHGAGDRVEEVEVLVVQGELDLLADRHAAASVHARAEAGALVVGEKGPLVV